MRKAEKLREMLEESSDLQELRCPPALGSLSAPGRHHTPGVLRLQVCPLTPAPSSSARPVSPADFLHWTALSSASTACRMFGVSTPIKE